VLIPLRDREGKVRASATVGEADFARVGALRWKLDDQGYAARSVRVDGGWQTLRLHREVLQLAPGDDRRVDHIDGDRLNNRRSNLRFATDAQNAQNRTRRQANNRSGFTGVCWHAAKKRWMATVQLDRRKHHLGYFDDPTEANAVVVAFRAEHMPFSPESRATTTSTREKAMIEIKRWTDGKVLYTAESAADVRTALEEAVKADANLSDADLSDANLRYANLRDANLSDANLRYANLRDANLRSANLRSADLRDANLRSANLGYADLGYANLRYANLRSADLGYADLGYADLGYANLRSANLRYANLRYANLGYADLGYANLRSADLGYADLGYEHPLWAFWTDFSSVLDQAPAEVAGLRAAIAEGNIDGSVYEGTCACLVGTIANVRHVSVEALDIPKDASRPAEQWFMPIRKGDVPLDDPSKATESEGVFRASVALKWIDEWAASRLAVAKALAA
jgi:hypothetical protein